MKNTEDKAGIALNSSFDKTRSASTFDATRRTSDFKDAINRTGHGRYNVCLTFVACFSALAAFVEMFGFAVTVSLLYCEFDLSEIQNGFILSIPFICTVLMAYPWGYIANVKGRQKCLIVSLSVSFVMATLCSFTSTYLLLLILKFIESCFLSGTQNLIYTLVGESTPEHVKNKYLILVCSSMHLGATVMFPVGYYVGSLEFSYDIGLIKFVPWRLLNILFALPLLVSVIMFTFFYESPKFLLHKGRGEEAITVLRQIYGRNGNNPQEYRVSKLVINASEKDDLHICESFRREVKPLFAPPLLRPTILLFYITIVIYYVNNSMYIWLPFLSHAFVDDQTDKKHGLCHMIEIIRNNTNDAKTCKTSVHTPVVPAASIYGVTACIINIILAYLADIKKSLLIFLLSINALCAMGTQTLKGLHAMYTYFGILLTGANMGFISAYYVDLYPTAHRSIVSSLGMMLARLSGAVGVNTMKLLIKHHCRVSFFGVAAFLFSCAIVSFLLPPDKAPVQRFSEPINKKDVTNVKPGKSNKKDEEQKIS